MVKRSILRKLGGTAWLAAWCGALWLVASPWRNLGGIESERLRWLEWWALCAGVALGFTIGRGTRDWLLSGLGRTHAMALRVALYPPALVTALALIALSIAGERGPIGIAATAFLSYWAGFDAAVGAVPLMEGEPHAFLRPLPSDDTGEDRRTWDRF
jgi:hypothetical protein